MLKREKALGKSTEEFETILERKDKVGRILMVVNRWNDDFSSQPQEEEDSKTIKKVKISDIILEIAGDEPKKSLGMDAKNLYRRNSVLQQNVAKGLHQMKVEMVSAAGNVKTRHEEEVSCKQPWCQEKEEQLCENKLWMNLWRKVLICY